LAYCYLLVPGDRVVQGEARKRLNAIREFTELGAGFRVAARDLEIRGAGNLLGAEQSGHIAAVGIETYLKMLEETVRELRGETVEAAPSVALDLPLNITIPSDYLSDANLRLEIYQRIAAGEVEGKELLAELQDPFGPPPPPVYGLLEATALKRLAESLRIQSISHQGQRLQVRFRRDSKVDVDRLVKMVSEMPGLTFSPSGILVLEQVAGAQALDRARGLLDELGG
jgi:transcription-repair coupling factor (superfamily II helicase)